MRNTGVTLKDIAARTGVSKVTVSYVLNERETRVRISDDTRRRVKEAAKDLGYRPNAVARALARRCTDTITLVMQSPAVFRSTSGFVNEMMHGVLDAANHLGYDLLLHTKTLNGVEAEMRALTDGRADGLLVLRDLGDPLVHELQAAEFPFVSLFSRSDEADAWFVDSDNVSGGFQAVEYLICLGHKRIGFVGGNPSSSAVRDRYRGYLDAHDHHNLMVDARLNCIVTFEDGDYAPLIEMMSAPDAPTALFVWSDDVAVGTIRQLQDVLCLCVPKDVSVIGFDGTEKVQMRSVPRLTSVRQPIYEIAEKAVRLLAARIRKEQTEQTKHLLAPTLAIGESCAVCKDSHVLSA